MPEVNPQENVNYFTVPNKNIWSITVNITEEIKQKICNDITQLQVDLQAALQRVLEQAGSKIELEKQEEVQQKFADTQQLLERFKGRYA